MVPPPESFITVEPPNVSQAHGYYRLMNLVESNAPTWVQFDFNLREIAINTRGRLLRLKLGQRYETILAGTKLYIRLKPGVTSLRELLGV